jgi:solute carrier family 10 (sodium/bile acid cotransporter), member 7
MTAFLRKRWFLVALALLIPSGIVGGMTFPKTEVKEQSSKETDPPEASAPATSGSAAKPGWFARLNLSQVITAVVLLLMAFSLDSEHLKDAIRSPGPVLWASLVNYGGIPLLAWAIAGWQQIPDFEIGLMIAATVPCTLAAASVWTRKALGNDAVSLMVTLLTNTACFLATPFWLNLTIGQAVTLNTTDMVFRLLIVVLVPTLLGQGLRQIPRWGGFATRQKTPIGVIAQSLILVLVFLAAFRAGQQLGGDGPEPSLFSIFLVWGSCIAVHLTAMGIGWLGSGLLNFSRENRAAIVFASSQKTLPIGVLIATAPNMLGNPDLLGPGLGIPFAVFPMLMYHASQLFIDTVVADSLATRARLAEETGLKSAENSENPK